MTGRLQIEPWTLEAMKRSGINLGLLVMCANLCGCVSMAVIDEAQGAGPKGDPKPGYYALLPLTIPLDLALVAAWGYLEGCAYGAGDFSSPSPGLKVHRP
jgi:hypothetical protein